MVQTYLLDVVQESWWQRNERDVVVLSIMGIVAVGALVGIIAWIKKRKQQP